MEYQELADFLRYVGKDPSTLIFEDELTGIHNRRFLLSYLEHKVDWTGGRDFPLALLNIDLDGFKAINDSHGHEMGDQVLTWVAALLQSVAGEDGVPVRYGGDEFLVLLPGADRDGALAVAAKLLQITRDRPFRERDSGLLVPVTMSVGIAVAPEDGNLPDALIHASDTALYAAKHRGRDQAALASEITEDSLRPKAALQRLKLHGIAGREEEFEAVDRTLRGFAAGRSQVLVFSAAPGVGKTALLDAIWRNLKADDSFFVARVSGDVKESRRPYYLAARILIDLLNQRGPVGVELLNRIPERERGYLAHVLPGLIEGEVASGVDRDTREGIFTTFTKVLLQAVGGRSLILLVDDLEFADEATLALLSKAADRDELSFMLCGTAGEGLRLSGETDASPVERFFEDCPDHLLVQQMVLMPLGPLAVADYLNTVFPNAEVPRGFEAELVRVTGGNPFFVSAIIRSLLEDGKVQLVGQTWVIEALAEGDLARTLEGVVTEKIAALDREDRELLERASTLGEEIPVSILAGSSALDEPSVNAFLDRAESLGLVRLDFQVNDEVMRFLGKAILDISYGAIDESRRAALHEDVGEYQEGLFERGLLSSASMLAYHFRRSANHAKARRYEQIQRAYTNSVFKRGEVAYYSHDDGPWEATASTDSEELTRAVSEAVKDAGAEIEAGAPLDAQALELVPQALRMILSAMKNAQLYPPESMAITRAMEQAMSALESILARSGRLTLTYGEGALIANGEPLDLSELRMLEVQMMDLLKSAALRAVSIARGVTLGEVRGLLLTMGTVAPGGIEPDFWDHASQEQDFRNVEVRQTHYTRVEAAEGDARKSRDAALSAAEAERIPGLVRDLLKTASDIRLYPLESARVSASVTTLLESLRPILSDRTSLSLAEVESLVLVNGERADITQWESVAEAFTSFLESSGLVSITFFSSISREDLGAFFGQLREQGGRPPEPGFWDEYGSEKGLSGIAFNKESYAPEVIKALLAEALQARGAQEDQRAPAESQADPVSLGDENEIEIDLDTEVEETAEAAEDEASEPALDESIVRVVKELLLDGKHDEVRDLIARVFSEYEQSDVERRTAIVRTCSKSFHQLVVGLQHRFSDLALAALGDAVAVETSPSVLAEAAALLYEMAAAAIRLSDYNLAARVYRVVDARRSDVRVSGEAPGSSYAALMDVELDGQTSQLLIEDLRSGNTERQAQASLAVGYMGATAVALLIDVVKQERDLRGRQLAAGLLADLGEEAAIRLKETLLTEVLLEHRYRVLQVVDLVTQDLRMELAFSLGDENPKIRRAAFQLFERLCRDDFVDLMLPAAQSDDPAVAKGAVRSLATVGTPQASRTVIQLLRETESPVLAVACCQALASLKLEAGVEVLGAVLSRRTMTRKFHWDEEVRAVAAVALRQTGTPRALAVLEEHQGDASTRIREIAQPESGQV